MLSVTTKTGDKGETGLANGQRLSKADPTFEVIGTLDELNSWLGFAAVTLSDTFVEQQQQIYEIQHALFDVGAEIAHSTKTTLTQVQLEKLEKNSENLQQGMKDEWHTQFLLPGGIEAAARVDIARTVCRRCERALVQYSQQASISPIILKYINRLSDFLYLLRCHVNAHEQYQELLYTAGKK
jgi:cob(I)alamin adenosyltransferase